MKESNIRNKTFLFAIRIVNLYKFLTIEKKEYVMSKQLLRCGTSVGAMIRESEYGESKLDFIHKKAIAQKEINEAIYWLELLNSTEYLSSDQFDSFQKDAIEILKIITAIILKAKANLIPKP
jgi:four helix bundle protein